MELRIEEEETRGAAIIMQFKKKDCTIADIEALPEGVRAELINGELYMLASPSFEHQELSMDLSVQIYNYINSRNGKCKVVAAPFAVYLHNDDKNYFEPDISVICDKCKIDKNGCHGAPDWIIEIVSPSSQKMDCVLKLKEYRKAGVREYWIVDAEEKTVTVHRFEKGDVVEKYSFTDLIPVGIYKDLELSLGGIV